MRESEVRHLRKTAAFRRSRRPALTRVLSWPALAAGLIGCGDGGGFAGAVRTDSAGIVIVQSAGTDKPLAWTFAKVLDLGGEAEGGLEFHRVHATSVGTDGNGLLYVLDAGNYRITVLDGEGNVLRTMGGQGGGPGEMNFPTDLGVGDDGMSAVWDFGVGGFLRYAADGTPLSTVAFAAALQRELAVVSGGIAGVFNLPRTETPDSVESRLYVLRATDTLDITGRNEPTPRMVTFDCMGLSLPPYLSPGIAWAARGERVIARTTAEYAVDVYESGRRVANWRRSVPTIPGSVAIALAEAPTDSFRMRSGAGGCAVSMRDAIEQIGHAALAPLVQDIQIARDGMVWIRRRTTTAGQFLIDVLTADGEYAGTLPAFSPWPAAFRGTDEIVTVETDDLDLPHVIIYRISRAAS